MGMSTATNPCRFEISPRPPEAGGGWRLQLFLNDLEVGGGVYPPDENFLDQQLATDAAHEYAYEEGAAWVES